METLLRHVTAGLALSLAVLPAARAQPACAPWPEWAQFKQDLISGDGRVIDTETPRKQTVSEGQAYALFFALVANDRKTFDTLLGWTQNNLARGDLRAHLPAWLWGKRANGKWEIVDSHSAADADLWLAYTLAEAGRLWDDRRYQALAASLALRILNEESDFLPGLGPTLLPGPVGFHPTTDRWRLNPSYVPVQLLRRMAALYPTTAWRPMLVSAMRFITEPAEIGFAPDWTLFERGRSFLPDRATDADGSYNAIRVYLWAGLLSPADPLRARLLGTFRPMVAVVQKLGYPPEHVNTRTGAFNGQGPVGFSAALVPFLYASGRRDLAVAQQRRAAGRPQASLGYYNQALTLFTDGWVQGRYRFATDGSLTPAWRTSACIVH